MSEKEESKNKSKESKAIRDNINSLPLKRNKPVRPQHLHVKTGYSYDVNLPTYEESQAKYEKFLLKLPDIDKKVTTNE